MIFALYRDAWHVIKENKAFILLFLLTYLSSIPRGNDVDFSLWAICGYWPVTLFLSLYSELYLIGMVIKYKNPLIQINSPSKLAQKYIWKSLLVTIVTFFWMLIVLGLPYVLIGVVRDLMSGIMLWSINFVWSILLNLIIFGLFNLGVIILVTRHSIALESPALGFLEVFKNFSHYLKVYLLTIVVSYLPIFISAILLVFRQGIGFMVADTSFSLNPYESTYRLLFHSDAKLFFALMFVGLYMMQKVVMTLSYFSRPRLPDLNFSSSTSA
ncbi:MAG: hypothetical protein IPP66_18275 [Anaerolineales bacterium]|nr:hypothetical protein [Anaerolineales bacterium]